MELDDPVCCCFHVSLRKLVNFARHVRPAQASRMSECLDAGTGCGWCIPYLRHIHSRVIDEAPGARSAFKLEITPEEYARQRAAYRAQSGQRHTWPDASVENERQAEP